MTDTPDTHEYTQAGRLNLLIGVARLSGADYIAPQPVDRSTLPGFIWGLVIGAVATACTLVLL